MSLTDEDKQWFGEHLDTKLTSLEGSIDSKLGSLEGSVDSKLGSLEGRLDTKLTSLESRIDAKLGSLEGRLDTKLASLEGRIDAKLDRRFEAFENHMTEVMRDMQSELLRGFAARICCILAESYDSFEQGGIEPTRYG